MEDDQRSLSRAAAQLRVDRIRAFRAELSQAEGDGALTLTDGQRDSLARYQDGILHELAERFDVDTSDAARRMSWGMRIVATLGAMALAVAVFLFFYRFWGLMGPPLQVTLLVAAPIVAVLLMHVVSRRERTLYFTGLLGAVAFACFILDLELLGAIFNLTPTRHALLAWGLFGIVLAYAYGLRLLLTAGLVCLIGWITVATGSWSHCFWPNLWGQPEHYLLAGLAALCAPVVIPHRTHDQFPIVYRILGSLAIFLPILVLSGAGRTSYLPLGEETVEVLYQLIGFCLAGVSIWLGIRFNLREVTNLGSCFFVVLLYIKLFDWWWDLMPRYLFFLLLGLIAVGLLFILMRLRGSARGDGS